MQVPGEVRGFWQTPGARFCDLAGCLGYGLHAAGQPSCRPGHSGPTVCFPRTDGIGQWEDGCCSPIGFNRGPPPGVVQQPVIHLDRQAEGVCSDSRSEVDHSGLAISEGAGHHPIEACRGHKGEAFLPPYLGTRCQEEGKGARKREEAAGGRPGVSGSVGLLAPRSSSSEQPGDRTAFGGTGDPRDKLPGSTSKKKTFDQSDTSGYELDRDPEEERFTAESLSSTISFRRLVAVLPRLIMKSRTRFSAALAKSFRTTFNGNPPCTTVFPLPLRDFDAFGGQTASRLSAAQWWKICRKRLLHIFIVFLNYLYTDGAAFDVSSLGRCPSPAQMRIHRHLDALITVSDLPGNHPLPPGRSGPEFIARLIELSNFVHASPLFNLGGYGGEFHEGIDQRGTIQKDHLFKPASEFSAVNPYRSLDAGRLKLTGQGSWPMADFIDDILWLPFLEPSVLRHGQEVTWAGPDFSRESVTESLKLAKLWSTKGLLALFDSPCEFQSRVFNAFKNEEVDRQIGDRRWCNGAEMHPSGPSAFLPAGVNLTSLHCPRGYKLVGCVTDRRDFYHQAQVSRSRAWSNQLPFAFHTKEFYGSSELLELEEILNEKYDREAHGDRLGFKRRVPLLVGKAPEKVYAGFSSLFQGDHLGVEYALASHTNLLRSEGLLKGASQILRHQPFPQGPWWEILVIDDYVIISREKRSCRKGDSLAEKKLAVAENIYKENQVLGSDDKTVRGETFFQAVGAEVISNERAQSAGTTAVAGHAAKRVSTSYLSLRLSALPVITRGLASRLAGQWVSLLMFRRCLTCTLDGLFALGTPSQKQANEVVTLTRHVAEELVLVSIAGFLAVTDISVDYDKHVYATDASNQRGAVTACRASDSLSQSLWLGGDRKGSYTMLEKGPALVLRQLGIPSEEDEKVALEGLPPSPTRSIDFAFDFVEICGGSGVLSKELARRGLRVCTPLDLTASKHFDLTNVKLLDWMLQMIHERRFLSVGCEPPCTTFSPAQYPASRSYERPLGFDRTERRTLIGTTLALRCLLMRYRCGAPGFLEQPRLSKMAWLSAWKWLLSLGLEEVVVASCMFGSIHRKEFRFLVYGFEVDSFQRKCSGGHSHIRIEGAYTKQSAIYVPGVVDHLATHIQLALKKRDASEGACGKGLESLIINDLLQSSKWHTVFSWRWRTPCHINILESHAYVGLLHRLAQKGGHRRFVALLDSRVAKGAHAKGRSSARSLQRSLRKACAITVAANLHPSFGFAPTRLNTADAPTRDRALPEPSDHSILEYLSDSQVATLHSHQFSRPVAGWLRLFILVTFSLCPGAGAWDLPGTTPTSSEHFALPFYQFVTAITSIGQLMGSGAECLLSAACLASFCFLFGRARRPISWLLLVSTSLSASSDTGPPKVYGFGKPQCSHARSRLGRAPSCFALAMPLAPRGPDDRSRAEARSGWGLQADRAVKQSTRNQRSKRLAEFDSWLADNLRTTLVELVDAALLDPEEICEALIAYGKEMFLAGYPYGNFAETINAVTQRRPALRRQLAAAWDLAFNWVSGEPRQHHPALPVSVLLGLCSLALLWGWPREAAIFAMSWAGLLRIGEIFSARRGDLVLPGDAAPGATGIILKIQEPKTRGRSARHQASRFEYQDIVRLVTAVFRRLDAAAPLWPWSPATLRRRFVTLQRAVGLEVRRLPNSSPYDLASLRPGGATFLLQQTEDSELVRRKGRWLSSRVLEIYIQEASVATYQQKMSPWTYDRITELAGVFSEVMERAVFFLDAHSPERAWPRLW